MNIEWKPVRNYSNGRFGYRPEAIVIHIAEGSLNGALSWFNNPQSQASAHYMIGKKGQIWQFVKEEDTAWHAGGVNRPSWSNLKNGVNPNLYTIGIEHEGKTGEPWTQEMLQASAWLISQISIRWNLPISRNSVIGHFEINSVSRSRCPGTGIDLNNLINLATNYEDPAMIKELQDTIKKLEDRIKILENQKRLSEEQIKTLTTRSEVLENRNKELQKILNEIENSPKDIQRLQAENAKLRVEVERVQQLEEELSRLKNNKKNPISTPNNSVIDRIIDRLFN